MTQIKKSVEAIKLAHLSHTPIVWLVVNDKEVADQIATTFMNEHLGGRDRSLCGDSGNGSYTMHDIKTFSADTAAGYDTAPRVYFNWFEEDSHDSGDSTQMQQLLAKFIDCFLHVDFEEEARTLYEQYGNLPRNKDLAIVASPSLPDLGWINKYVETVYVAPPDDEETKNIITVFLKSHGLSVESKFLDQLTVNFRGVSERHITGVLTKCLVSELFDDNAEQSILAEIRSLKRRMLDGFRGLKWVTVKDSDPKVAGLDGITAWLSDRRETFTDPEKSIKEGFDIPKGLLITGIPGTGKSLLAKQASRILDLPLVSMDLGDIQEGIVGKSEEHMAAALRMVDAMAPCVLWIDEIEKAFSGSESGNGDGGVVRRMFGKFLTWMQEKTSYCFVLATSNDISHLPPELFRSQRFDEKFYTFMPTATECAAMFKANIVLQNKRYAAHSANNLPLFDLSVFEKEDYWLNVLDNYCTCDILPDGTMHTEEVQLDNTGHWAGGYLPQKKLFTGADIAAFVGELKFRVLNNRKHANSGFSGPIKKAEAEAVLPAALADFMPYGQTNLKDIAKCFVSLSKNRFRSASQKSDGDAIIRFSDYDETSKKMKYCKERFSDAGASRYDRTLYRCIVGAINGLEDNNNR